MTKSSDALGFTGGEFQAYRKDGSRHTTREISDRYQFTDQSKATSPAKLK